MRLFRTLTSAVLLTSMGSFACGQVTLALWTFEVSAPNSSGPILPETGSGSATSNTGGAFSAPAGNGSSRAWSSNGWNVGEYFQFQVSTTGFQNIVVTWDQTGSNTGPRDFTFQYSTDGSTFTNQFTYSLTNDSWNISTYNPVSTRTVDLGLVTAVTNAPTVFFRLTQTGTAAINGTPGPAGTGRVDNFTVTGVAIPEPSTIATILGALVVAGVLISRRR